VARLPGLVRTHVIPALPQIVREAPAAVNPHMDAWGEVITRTVGGLTLSTERLFERVGGTAAEAALADAGDANRRQLGAQAKAVIGVDPIGAEPWIAPLLEDAVAENVKLIRSVPTKYFGRLESVIRERVREGLRHEEIAALLERDFAGKGPELERARSSAELIARDQTLKFYGTTNRIRQQQLGVARYRWRTARDERVRGNPGGRYPQARPSHFAREDKIFEWDAPPPDGHPGQAVNCRCISEPVFEDLLEGLPDQSLDPALFQNPRVPIAPNRPQSVPIQAPAPPAPSPPPTTAPRRPEPTWAIEAAAAQHARIPLPEREIQVAPEAREAARRIFGREISPEKLADVAGMPAGTSVTVKTISGGQVELETDANAQPGEIVVRGQRMRVEFRDRFYNLEQPITVTAGDTRYDLRMEPGGRVTGPIGVPPEAIDGVQAIVDRVPYTSLTLIRTARREAGEAVLHNDLFVVLPQGRGMGAQIFARQVAEARAQGIARFETDAAEGGGLVGYYTWARLGYDGQVQNASLRERFGIQTVQELMAKPGGREAWKAEGHSFGGTFDLTDRSTSMRVLEAYLEETAARRR
jgi:SPP1 gp7 family putative phage head morphogenesis protein